MKKIIITMEETRRIEREFDISENDFLGLATDSPEDVPEVNKRLDMMYGEILDAKDADTEYDYKITDENEKELVPFSS